MCVNISCECALQFLRTSWTSASPSVLFFDMMQYLYVFSRPEQAVHAGDVVTIYLSPSVHWCFPVEPWCKLLSPLCCCCCTLVFFYSLTVQTWRVCRVEKQQSLWPFNKMTVNIVVSSLLMWLNWGWVHTLQEVTQVWGFYCEGKTEIWQLVTSKNSSV